MVVGFGKAHDCRHGLFFFMLGLSAQYHNVYTIEEWKDAVNDEWITNDDGTGYWVKDALS